MRFTSLLLILFLCPIFTFAQDATEKQKLLEDYFYKGLAFSNTEKDSSYFNYNLALKYARELENYPDALEILFSLILTSRTHGDLKSHDVFSNQIDAILKNDVLQVEPIELQYYHNRYAYDRATYFYDTKNYDKAKEYFRKLYLLLADKSSTKSNLYDYNYFVHTTNYLALIYTNTGKFELAENYFERSLRFIQNNPIEESEGYRLATLQLFAQLYRLTSDYKKSNMILEEMLPAYKDRYSLDKGYKNNLNAVYGKLVENAIEQARFQKALYYLNEGQNYLLDDDPFYKRYLILYGDIYSGLGENLKSLEKYQKALEHFQEFRQRRPHEDIAEVYGKIAGLHLKQKYYQKGLENIKEAFNTAGNKIQITNINENPVPKQVFSKTQLLSLLDIKLQLLQGNLEKTADTTYQAAILKTSRDILTTFDLLKSEFDSKLDKQFLAEKAYPIFYRLLETTHKAYEKDPSVETMQLALNIAEKNKDFVLLEALRNAQANQYGDVPEAILEKESQLRAEITNVEKQLFDTKETKSEFSEVLFNLKQEYFGFLDTLKTKYPKYHELKYQNRTLDLATVRKKVLDDNGTLISYSLANDQLYTIVVNGSKQDFIKVPFDEADRETIREFYRMLSTPTINKTKQKIADIANSLFEKVLQIPLADFDTENLTIIPDGELHYLPFDLLQENGSYLLETKNIAYGNSVTSLLELKEKKHAEHNKMLAFAPSFSGAVAKNSDRQFGKLLYNDDEVQKIEAFYETETLFEKQATLANFISKASDFNIFHLATHASANDEYPDYSYLAFTEVNDSTESNILYIKDLYNTTLNADLLTLSACQTGIGKLQKGQGMLSLSKGFYYAGAKSIVNTLWKINDKSTVRLMEYFYENLSNGQSKKEALRNAKLKYLETTDDDLLKHPYYWAAFVVSGDVSPISRNNNWLYLGVGSLSLVTVFFFFLKQKRKRKVFDAKVSR